MIRAEMVQARDVSLDYDRELPDGLGLWSEVSHLERQYPGFRSWYFGKVVPGIITGHRCVLTRRHAGRLVGLAIAKRGEENKLCTLWVDPRLRGLGIANGLADEVFDWMGSHHPLFTVPEEHLCNFSGLLNRWAFVQTQIISSYYRPGKQEFVFNGTLEPHWSS
jgi:hypothetical protein